MAQKRRPPKTAGLDRVTLMVPVELKARLEADVELGTRTFSDVVRERLRMGLEAPMKGIQWVADSICRN